ncbi:hypothetical protein LOTGIDRAFT_165559 [Lottia gigantea]|uniref:Uncharacterized protein n=1 Tax=Lottia gigantea TaxID=225164 RepID=V4A0K8_LOTGI|nr:hypothetical protein LOTGIDRAFT_165559 [Lottia gigantea]ESO88435.1 hypothetical protein LOTGIDRAFT_165559 [Lottia gigantea]
MKVSTKLTKFHSVSAPVKMKSLVFILFCATTTIHGSVLPERQVCHKNGNEITIGGIFIDKSKGVCRTYYCIEGNPPHLDFASGSLQCSDEGRCYERNTELRKNNCVTWKCSEEQNGWEITSGCAVEETCLHDRESVMKFDGTMCTCSRGILHCI